MDAIRSLLRIAAHRLELGRFLGIAHIVFLVIAVVALVLIPAERLGSQLFLPWLWLAPALVVGGLAISLAVWASRRLSEHQVAVAVDERLDLREKLSTALCVERDDDAFARAALEDAVRTATDSRTRERVRRQFAVTAPDRWWLSPLIVFVALMLSAVGPLDLFRREVVTTPPPDVIDVGSEENALGSVIETIEQQAALKAELEDLLEGLVEEPIDPTEMGAAEDIKREAIKNLTKLNERLEEIIDGEKGKTIDALEKSFKRLDVPEEGPAKEFAEALARGDFGEAKEKLEALLEKLEKGELSPEQQEQLAEQLEDIAAQLEKLAGQQQALEDALEKAGLDPQLAQNPQALQQAIQNDPNLDEQQKQQLQQMAQAQQAAQQMAESLAQACQGLAQACQGAGQMGQAGDQLGGQLNQLEQMQMLLRQAQGAMGMCQGQCQNLGQGLSMDELLARGGGAFGNRGQSSGGGKAPLAPTPWQPQMEKADVQTTAGDVIASMKVDGPVTIGETTKTATRVVTEVVDAYEEAKEEQPLPRKYSDAQKHYFGEWERQAKTVESGAAPAGGNRSNTGGAEPGAPESSEGGD